MKAISVGQIYVRQISNSFATSVVNTGSEESLTGSEEFLIGLANLQYSSRDLQQTFSKL